MAEESAGDVIVATHAWITDTQEWITHTRAMAARLEFILPATAEALRVLADDVADRLAARPEG